MSLFPGSTPRVKLSCYAISHATGLRTLADPATLAVTVLGPDGLALASYVKADLDRQSAGIYWLPAFVVSAAGQHRVHVVSTGVDAVSWRPFRVLEAP